MCKNVAFAQGLAVLVPKQQWLISQCVELTIGDAMQAKQRVKKNFQVDNNLEKPKGNREILWWNFKFWAWYGAWAKFVGIYSIRYSDT